MGGSPRAVRSCGPRRAGGWVPREVAGEGAEGVTGTGGCPERGRGTGGSGAARGVRLPAAGTRERCRGARAAEGPGRPGRWGPSSLSRRPQERPASPRPRLHAPPAVATRPPGSNHLIAFPLGWGRAPPPATSRHLPRAAAPPSAPPGRPPLPSPRPARSPGSPRSPALDNALVKTAELFLTSPPPLLIKAPP